MEKRERFAIVAKVKIDGKLDDIVVTSFDTYPTDSMLEQVWHSSKANELYDQVYWLKVEKQVRFV